MLVGAVQSVANWWAEHPEVAREQAVEMVMDFAWLGLERLSARRALDARGLTEGRPRASSPT